MDNPSYILKLRDRTIPTELFIKLTCSERHFLGIYVVEYLSIIPSLSLRLLPRSLYDIDYSHTLLLLLFLFSGG